MALSALFSSFSSSQDIVVPRAAGSSSVISTILIIARDATSAFSSYSGLQGYGIPYQVLTVPSTGTTLPQLNSSATLGNYGGIVIMSEVSYDYDGNYSSALTAAQMQQLYDYQIHFGVRMVRLDVYPEATFGVSVVDPNGNGNDEPVSITNATGFPTAGIKTNAPVSIAGIFHYPATITNHSIAWEIAAFNGSGTAAVVNNIGGRLQQVWFLPFATDWSPASNFLQHAWIHFLTRGIYLGFRRMYFNTQIDDMFLETDMYQPNDTTFRIRADDLTAHVTWMANINSRMPAGSTYFMEVGHNGNGNIEESVDDDTSSTICDPGTGIEYPDQIDTVLEYQKVLGTGTNVWPDTPVNYTWSDACTQLDELQNFFADTSNLNAFAHVSHTFTHEALNNATYDDTYKEIQFNQYWLKQVGISKAARFSSGGIIPPAITGLHNGDAIRAWLQLGIKYVVGDNTRPVLLNTDHPFWALTSTVANNGYAGLIIVPRWATTIYYNCDTPDCTLAEWVATSGGSGDFTSLLNDARATNTRHLLGLHGDPYMFHQANLRQTDVDETVVNGVSQQLSLFQIWVEVVVAEMMRLTTWPFVSQKHDDIAATFINRQTRDNCNPNIALTSSADGKSIIAATVFTTGNTCGTPVPVTVPGKVTATTGATTEQLGSDPLTLWVTMSGAQRTYMLSTPVPI
ncbi:hypothetical protein AOQ84DRAFT_430940 [Glonium stellatum]|uniref:Extracellular serine-rich protein n=1 Tax=Glonium stellatum TaxID=574774 RepID=A0A8E2JUK7_9PEZI|nr:hypothetical protein AOQ84DRAFT_430940 [Glonium stellatum]